MISESFMGHYLGRESLRLSAGLSLAVRDDVPNRHVEPFGARGMSHPTRWDTASIGDDQFLAIIEAGACAQTDPDAFFADDHHGQAFAKRICFQCPVQRRCLEWAIGRDLDGVWGGASKRQRLEFRRAIREANGGAR